MPQLRVVDAAIGCIIIHDQNAPVHPVGVVRKIRVLRRRRVLGNDELEYRAFFRFTLNNRIRPPMISVSLLLMARPRPVPPYFLVVDESTWLKERNRRSNPSAGMPQPVSRTAK